MDNIQKCDCVYKIEILVYGSIADVYTALNIEDIYDWYKEKWQTIYDYDGCTFYVYDGDEEIPYENLIKYGF